MLGTATPVPPQETPVEFRLWRRRQGQWALVDTVKEPFLWAVDRPPVASIDPIHGSFVGFASGEVWASTPHFRWVDATAGGGKER